MPMALQVNWDLARKMFEEGVTLKSIAARTGIPYGALSKRRLRYLWQPPSCPLPETKRTVKKTDVDIHSKYAQQTAVWKARILDIADKHLSHVEDRSGEKISLEDLERLVRITDSVDKTARRTFGLDNEHHSTVTLQVQSELPAQRQLEDRNAVLEVETVPNLDTPKTPPEQ